MGERLKAFGTKYGHAWTFSYFIFFMLVFQHLEKTVVPEYIMHCRLDDFIPFMKIFVIPYLFWYIYIGIALGYFFFHSKTDFYKLSAFLYIGMTISLAVYYILPNGQLLRPVLGGDDILSRMVKAIYLADTPTNSAPSMHVIDTLAVHCALIHYKGFRHPKLIKNASFVTMILICLSTMFLKQHSALDVFWGLVVSAILYTLIYKKHWKGVKVDAKDRWDYNRA